MKIGVIGIGTLGSSIVSYIAYHHLASELVLIDKDQDRAARMALDMVHGISLLSSMSIISGGYELLTNADVIIISAGVSRSKHETRLDLTQKNHAIMKEIMPHIAEYNQSAVIIITTEPVDIMAYIALKLSGFQKNKIIGLGTLVDTIRYNSLVSRLFRLSPQDVDFMVIGEHGQSMVPLQNHAYIKGIQLEQFHGYEKENFHQLIQKLIKSGDELIALGGNSLFTPTLAIGHILDAIIQDSSRILTVSGYVSGAYSIKNICISLPFKVGANGIEEVFQIQLSEPELHALKISEGILNSEIQGLE